MNIRIALDSAMTVLILTAMAYRIIGGIAHEITGVAAIALFICHNILNYRWYRNLAAKRYTGRRYAVTAVNVLLVLNALVLAVSGILHSKDLFGLASEENDSFAGRWQIHALAAYWTFVLISVHLGIYWNTIAGKFWPRRSAIMAYALRAAAAITALWGIKACLERNLGSKLILYYSFDFWHTEEHALSYMASYFTIMVMLSFTTYYILKIKKTVKSKKGEYTMKKTTAIFSILSAAITLGTANGYAAQSEPKEQIAASAGKGEAYDGPDKYFTGKVKVQPIAPEISPPRNVIAYVTFEAGARSNWHDHDGGQTLVVTEGNAWTQEWNGKAYEAKPGEIIYCPPNIKHFHGASPEGPMTHVSIVENIGGKNVTWMEPVTDEQYKGE